MSCTVTKYKQRLAKIRQAPRVLVCELHTANPNVAVDYYVSTTWSVWNSVDCGVIRKPTEEWVYCTVMA